MCGSVLRIMYCITYAKLCKLYGYCRGAWQGCFVFVLCSSVYADVCIVPAQYLQYKTMCMSVYFVFIVVERGTSGGRVAGHVTASGPLGTCLYVQGVQNSGYSGLRKV